MHRCAQTPLLNGRHRTATPRGHHAHQTLWVGRVRRRRQRLGAPGNLTVNGRFQAQLYYSKQQALPYCSLRPQLQRAHLRTAMSWWRDLGPVPLYAHPPAPSGQGSAVADGCGAEVGPPPGPADYRSPSWRQQCGPSSCIGGGRWAGLLPYTAAVAAAARTMDTRQPCMADRPYPSVSLCPSSDSCGASGQAG